MWQWCGCLDHRDPGGARYAGKLAVTSAGDMLPLKSFASLWQLFRSEHRVWRYQGFLDCGDLSGGMRAVKPAAMSTEDINCKNPFLASISWRSKRSSWLDLLYCAMCQELKGLPLKSFSIGQLLTPACWERVVTVMASPSVHESAVAFCLPGCSAFLQRHSVLQPSPSCLLQPSS